MLIVVEREAANFDVFGLIRQAKFVERITTVDAVHSRGSFPAFSLCSRVRRGFPHHSLAQAYKVVSLFWIPFRLWLRWLYGDDEKESPRLSCEEARKMVVCILCAEKEEAAKPLKGFGLARHRPQGQDRPMQGTPQKAAAARKGNECPVIRTV